MHCSSSPWPFKEGILCPLYRYRNGGLEGQRPLRSHCTSCTHGPSPGLPLPWALFPLLPHIPFTLFSLWPGPPGQSPFCSHSRTPVQPRPCRPTYHPFVVHSSGGAASSVTCRPANQLSPFIHLEPVLLTLPSLLSWSTPTPIPCPLAFSETSHY